MKKSIMKNRRKIRRVYISEKPENNIKEKIINDVGIEVEEFLKKNQSLIIYLIN